MDQEGPLWIFRDYRKCSGCRRCEIACSLHHEGKIWPEASRIRVFMYVPGVDIPHFCAQCDNAPCVESCKFDALSVSPKTGAILVDRDKCTACGACIWACPGNIPHLHPNGKYALICDLCDGDPQCVRVCKDGKWDVLEIEYGKHAIIGFWDALHKLYAQTPEKITKRVAKMVYGEAGEDLV